MNPINQSLLEDGWKTWPNQLGRPGEIAFAKSFEGHAECACNKGKRKQVEIYFHPLENFMGHTFVERWTVKCTGELPDGEWLRMMVESLSSLESIQRTVQTLLTIWDKAVRITIYKERE